MRLTDYLWSFGHRLAGRRACVEKAALVLDVLAPFNYDTTTVTIRCPLHGLTGERRGLLAPAKPSIAYVDLPDIARFFREVKVFP